MVDRVAVLQARLALFEPQTKAQELVHENALRQFNTFYEHRRARIYSLTSDIPAILWYTIAVGALIQHDPHMAVRSPPSCSLDTWRTYIVLPGPHHLGDCPDGPPLPRRTKSITSGVPTDLRSGNEKIAAAFLLAFTLMHLPMRK